MPETRSARGVEPEGAEILLLDGSAFFREALADALAAAGHRCRAFADLAAAGAALSDPRIALWILDLDSTGEAGIEAFGAARRERPALRAIVLATHAAHERVLAALRAGASDYLAKPLHEEELRLSVARALAAHRTERELARLREAAATAAPDAEAEADLALARDLCLAVASESDPDRLLGALLRRLGERLGARSVALHRAEPGTGAFVREAEWRGPAPEALAVRERARLPPGRGLCGAAAATGVFVAASEPASDPRFDPEVDTPAEGGGGGLLCLPLRFRRHTIGLVRAFLPPGRAPDLRTAETAGAALSAAMRSVLLYRSWRSSIDEVARIRREAGSARPPHPPGWAAPE